MKAYGTFTAEEKGWLNERGIIAAPPPVAARRVYLPEPAVQTIRKQAAEAKRAGQPHIDPFEGAT